MVKPRGAFHEKALGAEIQRRPMRKWHKLIDRFTCPNLYVDGRRLPGGRATGVVSCVRLEGVGDFQLAVRTASVLRFDAHSGAARIKVQ